MKIQVTSEHIHLGIPNSCGRCPVALAIRDAFRKICQSVIVGRHWISIKTLTGEMHWSTPEVVVEFISEFDLTHHHPTKVFLPFEFYLELSEEEMKQALRDYMKRKQFFPKMAPLTRQ